MNIPLPEGCSITDCDRPVFVKSRGWCSTHYSRWQRTGDPLGLKLERDPVKRFWGKVTKIDGGCWLWEGSTTGDGYPRFSESKTIEHKAHRWAYEQIIGEIPFRLQLDHDCHTRDQSCLGGTSCVHRRCVNPAHLIPVTGAENVLRIRSQVWPNARKHECPWGHQYDEINSYITPAGGRQCRTCNRERARRWREACAS